MIPRLRGYRCLYHAIMLVYENETYIHHMTKMLYPTVGQKCGIDGRKADNAMRYAIEQAFKKANIDICEKIFVGKHFPLHGKLTNGHFIAAVVDYLKAKA